MRHQVAGRHLNRTSAHRIALRRNLAASLFEHGTISTTREKAKFVKPFAEKLITLAKNGSLHARRRAISLLQDRDICKIEDGEPVKVDRVINKLFSEIGPSFNDRQGGYTRIIKLPLRRIGDNGQLVLLQLVTEKPATPAVKSKVQEIVEEPQSQEPVEKTDIAEPAVQTENVEPTKETSEQPSDAADTEKAPEENT
jgi:large subunit ribosomal protein L17